MSRFGRSLADLLARVVTRSLFRVDAQGLEKIPMEGPFILVSNHVTAFELPPLRTLLCPRVVRTLAKTETWDNKFLGWLLDQWETIPIRRGESDMTALRTSLRVLKEGGILAIMPEGTRSGDGKLGRGNPGIAVIALKSGCSIVPMAFWGVEKAKANVRRFRRTDFHFRVGDSFDLEPPSSRNQLPKGLKREDRQRMADDVMRHIANLLPDEYRGKYSES